MDKDKEVYVRAANIYIAGESGRGLLVDSVIEGAITWELCERMLLEELTALRLAFYAATKDVNPLRDCLRLSESKLLRTARLFESNNTVSTS